VTGVAPPAGLGQEPILAIDFGTSYSAACLALPDGDLVEVPDPLSNGTRWPSIVCVTPGGIVVGDAAARMRRAAANETFFAEFKRDLTDPRPAGAGEYPPARLVAEMIGAIADAARALLAKLRTQRPSLRDAELGRTVLTVPVSYPGQVTYNPRRLTARGLMVAAAEKAGLGPVELLHEPVAAAWGLYGLVPSGQRRLVLVYDFGGGTFDSALVELGCGEGRALGRDAERTGGLDIDEDIVRLFDERTAQWQATRAQGPGQAALSRHVLKGAAERAKRQLSQTTGATPIVVPDAPEVRLSGQDLAACARDHVAKTIACYRNLLAAADPPCTVSELNMILLVGGTTRMPAVRRQLVAALREDLELPPGAEVSDHSFGFNPEFSVTLGDLQVGSFGLNPDLAVVRGAARWAVEHPIESIESLAHRPGQSALRWDLGDAGGPQGDRARLMHWHAGRDDDYRAGTPLARVRSHDGTLLDLVARGPGVLGQRLLAPQDDNEGVEAGVGIESWQWIATTERW
jgi:molecular chaperone DnaK (HSP70)